MSAHQFGLGSGHLSRRIARIARTHGAELVNYTEPGCRCGWGCSNGRCKAAQRHWFECENRGAPFDEKTAREVMAAIGGGK